MRNSTLALILGILLIPFTASAGLPTWLGGKPAPTAAQVQVQQINNAIAQATAWCAPFSVARLGDLKVALAAGNTSAAADVADQLDEFFNSCATDHDYVANTLEASLRLSEAQCNGNIIARIRGAKNLRETRATAYWEAVRSNDPLWTDVMVGYKNAADKQLASCTR